MIVNPGRWQFAIVWKCAPAWERNTVDDQSAQFMRIGLNLLHAQPAIGGGWNYIRNIVRTIREHDCRNQYIAYCTSESESLIKDCNIVRKVITQVDPNNRLGRVLYENSILQILARRDCVDVMHWFANTHAIINSVKSVVTIYDLLTFRDPSLALHKRLYIRLMMKRTMSRANVLAPMSEATAEEIRRNFHLSHFRMVVVPNPLGDEFVPSPPSAVTDLRAKYRLPEQFWLYVAHYYPHKNHERLFTAYAGLLKHSPFAWPLLLCGRKNGAGSLLERTLRDRHIVERVTWLPELKDAEMPLLYSAATALVFPSTFEGCGMPVGEAMACGCPVVASDIPTTREFAGDAAVLFDPLEHGAITAAMRHFQEDANLRLRCRRKGLETVERYRPRRIMERLANAYALAHGG